MENITAKGLKKNCVISVDMQASAHKELLGSYLYLFSKLEKADQELFLKEISNKKPNQVLTLSKVEFKPIYAILLTVILIEKAAEEQDLTEDTTVNIEELKKQLGDS